MTENKKARYLIEFDEQFNHELPAFTVDVISSNSDVRVDVLRSTPFSIEFKLTNLSNEHQLISGSIGDEKETFYVFGKSLHEGSESKVSEGKSDSNENTVEISSRWIQDKSTAERVAKWLSNRISSVKLEIELDIVGNPTIEVGDIIKIYHHDIEIDYKKDFVVRSVSLDWSEGLSTRLVAIEL